MNFITLFRYINGEGGLHKNGKKSTTLNEDTGTTKSVKRQRKMSKKDLDPLSSCASSSFEANEIAVQSSGNPTKSPLRQENGMALKISSEVCNAEGGLDKNGEKATALNEDTATTTKPPAKRQREMSKQALDTLRSSCASFSLEVSSLAAQSSGDPTTLATKNTCAEGLKISSIELGRKNPLSGLKLQGLKFDSRKSRIRKDIKPVGNIAQFPNSQKQTPHTRSRKRKTLEPSRCYHKGTTVVGIASYRKYLGVVADGRGFVKEDEWYPTSEDDDDLKIFTKGKDFVASMAGSYLYGHKLIEELVEIKKSHPQLDMENVIEHRKLNITEWEKDPIKDKFDSLEDKRGKNVYPASVVLYGFDKKGAHVASKGMGVEEVVIARNLKVVAHGSGRKLALKHLLEIKDRIISLNDALECLQECLAAVSLQTIYCGVNIRAVSVTPVGGIDLSHERKHVTSIIVSHFKSLEKYMENMLLFYTPGSYLKSRKFERKKEKYLMNTFPGLRIGILGYDEASSKTVRWLVFKSPADLEKFKITPLAYFGEYCEPTKRRFEKLSKLFDKSEKCQEVCNAEGGLDKNGEKATTLNEATTTTKPVKRQRKMIKKALDSFSEVCNAEGGSDKNGEKATALNEDTAMTTKPPAKRQREMSKQALDTLSTCSTKQWKPNNIRNDSNKQRWKKTPDLSRLKLQGCCTYYLKLVRKRNLFVKKETKHC